MDWRKERKRCVRASGSVLTFGLDLSEVIDEQEQNDNVMPHHYVIVIGQTRNQSHWRHCNWSPTRRRRLTAHGSVRAALRSLPVASAEPLASTITRLSSLPSPPASAAAFEFTSHLKRPPENRKFSTCPLFDLFSYQSCRDDNRTYNTVLAIQTELGWVRFNVPPNTL